MKHTKTFAALILAISLCLSLASCSLVKKYLEKTYTVAVIATTSDVTNRSTAQGAYTGVEEYCLANGLTYLNYVPEADSDENYKKLVDSAAASGAKLMVFPGEALAAAAKYAAEKYPDMGLLLVDFTTRIESARCHSITFREAEAGFLAGYAAVSEGYTSLGFIGANSSSISSAYGYGFIQGVDYAAASAGIAAVNVKYWYAEVAASSEQLTNIASSWFGGGVQVIMGYGDVIQKSLISAANTAKGSLIGCDMDQAGRSEKYLTSAEKSLEKAVSGALTDYFKKSKWSSAYAGTVREYGITDDCVSLPTNYGSFRFKKWTEYDYLLICTKLKNGSVTVRTLLTPPEVTVCTVEYLESGMPDLPAESSAE